MSARLTHRKYFADSKPFIVSKETESDLNGLNELWRNVGIGQKQNPLADMRIFQATTENVNAHKHACEMKKESVHNEKSNRIRTCLHRGSS
jgi:hypothetical protein